MPRIRSERPAFEAHYPHLQERLAREAHAIPRRPAATVGSDDRDARDTDSGS
jgi:cytochrome c oxidase subunit 1